MCRLNLTIEVISHDSSSLTKVTCMAGVFRTFIVTITDLQAGKSKHISDVFVFPIQSISFLFLFLRSDSERIDRTEHRVCGIISDDARVPQDADSSYRCRSFIFSGTYYWRITLSAPQSIDFLLREPCPSIGLHDVIASHCAHCGRNGFLQG